MFAIKFLCVTNMYALRHLFLQQGASKRGTRVRFQEGAWSAHSWLDLSWHRDPVSEARHALAMAVACGEGFTSIVTEQRDAWAFGASQWGQLGLGSKAHQLLPVHVGGREVFAGEPLVMVAAGYNHTAGVTKDGALWNWGFHANLDRDLHAFGSYCIGHLPRESKLVQNTTLDDRGLEGTFLMSDHSTPTFWMWSLKFNKPMKMCDGIFNPTWPFRDPPVLQHPDHLSHENICAMHAADGGFDQDDVSVPQYDLRSHSAPVHDAPSHSTSIERRQQVDTSNVIGDANAPQGQTRARTH